MITLVLKSCTCDGRLLFGWQWRNGSEMKCSNQTQIPPSVHSISLMELLGSRITLCIVSLRIHDHYLSSSLFFMLSCCPVLLRHDYCGSRNASCIVCFRSPQNNPLQAYRRISRYKMSYPIGSVRGGLVRGPCISSCNVLFCEFSPHGTLTRDRYARQLG